MGGRLTRTRPTREGPWSEQLTDPRQVASELRAISRLRDPEARIIGLRNMARHTWQPQTILEQARIVASGRGSIGDRAFIMATIKGDPRLRDDPRFTYERLFGSRAARRH